MKGLASLIRALSGRAKESGGNPYHKGAGPGGGQFTSGGVAGGGGMGAVSVKHDGMPANLIASDGGPISSVLYHGTSQMGLKEFRSSEIYLTDNGKEAAAYALNAHRPWAGQAVGVVMNIQRKPGPTRNIDKALMKALQDGDDMGDTVNREVGRVRKQGFRYLFYHHPSNVYKTREQRVVVSLFPQQDLTIRR